MAEKSKFFNSTTSDERYYDATDMAEIFHTFFGNGTIEGLEVTATSNGLSVSPGMAIINGYWYKLDSAKTLTISSSTSEHTDTVVLRLNLGSEARNITVAYKSGTTLTTNGDIYEIALAQATIAANSTTVKSVVDKRELSKIAGKAEISSTEVLSKLLAVDGSGSKLDSDLLDGQHGSYYGNYANLSNKPIRYGTAEPSSAVGNNGDIYIQY
ncbi:MAG: hypothetical protein SOT80_06600 [Candidatus Pseudoruminococcus sp.]|nr:hypothetical protein [Ruminococcus sp.]MDY2783060.1 hypothetical protein [Candidatus Pseudoruminococcus sp.]